MPRFGSILPIRNKLVYPFGTSPGFDPDHIALSSGGVCRFSAINVGAGFINLLNGRPPDSITTTFTSNVFFTFPVSVNAGTSLETFSTGINLVTETAFLFAAIFYSTNTATGQNIVSFGSSGSNGYTLGTTVTGKIAILIGATSNTTGVAYSANVPYLVLVGRGPTVSTGCCLLKRLDTGQITTANLLFGTAASTPTTGVQIGKASGALLGGLAACAYIGGGDIGSSLVQLQAWAADPWSFWFPNTPLDWVGKIAAAATTRVPLRMRMGMGV